jgi:hypothetical protein
MFAVFYHMNWTYKDKEEKIVKNNNYLEVQLLSLLLGKQLVS